MILKNVFYLHEQGLRKTNEDNIYPKPGTATIIDKLFIVCDGVGGQSSGEVASQIVSEAIPDFINLNPVQNSISTQILDSVNFAKVCLKKHTIKKPKTKLMSTTLALVYLCDKEVLVAWCGDSRIYHIRDGKVLWQSKDHSIVQQMIDDGEITKEEALVHPERNFLSHSINAIGTYLKVDIHPIKNAEQGDYIFLCTDGILENIAEVEIMNILENNKEETDKSKLFMEYCEDKTDDNFSMYLLQL